MKSILPKKHISLEQSYFGLGAKIISLLHDGKTVDCLWQQVNSYGRVKHSYADFILTLDYLYCLNVIKLTEEGTVCLN